MSYVQMLFNGSSGAVNCASCGASLEDERERAIASTRGGIKYFCRAPEDNPMQSCYNTWRMRHN